MHFVNSRAVYIVFPIFIALSALIIIGYFRRSRIVRNLFSPEQRTLLLSNYSRTLRILRLIALSLALFLVSVSVLDPRWGSRSTEYEIEGIDVVLVMDISQSMLTPDVLPDRLEYSQSLAQQLISILVGNRIGIAAFAGYGFKVIPLTMDVEAAIIFLNELSTSMIDIQGTNLEDAIEQATELFDEEALTHKAMVVFTDGEDMEYSPEKAAEKAAAKGITIFTIGIGSPEGGEIPLYDDDGNQVGYLEEDGEKVISQLDEETLSETAAVTGGVYLSGNEDNIILLGQYLDEIEKSRFGSNVNEFMQPQFQYFLLMAVLLILIFLFLPDRSLRKRIGVMPVLVFLFLLPTISFASEASDGVEAYNNGSYDEALSNFQAALVDDPGNERLRFNEGNTYYQLEEYAQAGTAYAALSDSEDEELALKAEYNLGNAFYMMQQPAVALNSFKKVIEQAEPDSELYRKAINNFILCKEMLSQQQNQDGDEDSESDENGDEQQDQDQNQDQNSSDDENDQNSSQQQSQQDQQVEPISPSEIESLLNLIEEEEKEHLSEEEEHEGILIAPRQKW